MIRINYKSWELFKNKAKEKGIQTFADLDNYCKEHNLHTYLQLCLELVFGEGGGEFGND